MSMSMAKHLKQIKKKVLDSPFRKRGFGVWPMKNGVKMKKNDWVEEVGEKKMAPVFDTAFLCLFPRKSQFGCLFRVVRGGSPWGSPRSSP